jgi:hypothetical protein
MPDRGKRSTIQIWVSLKSSGFVVPPHGFHDRTDRRIRSSIHKKDKIETEGVMPLGGAQRLSLTYVL